jgi:hypothetical protein
LATYTGEGYDRIYRHEAADARHTVTVHQPAGNYLPPATALSHVYI